MRTCGSMHRWKRDRLFGYLLLSYCCVVFACIAASGEVSMVQQQQQQQNQTEPSSMGKVFGPKEPIEVDHPGVLAAAQKISEAYAEVLSSPAYHDVNLDQPWFSLHKVLKAETKKAQGVKLFMDMVLYNPLALIPDLETRLTKTAQEAKNQETESITQGDELEQEKEGEKRVKAVNKKDWGGFSKWQSEQYLYITDWSKRLELQQQQNLPEVRRKQLMGYLMGLHPTKMSKHLKGGNRIPGLMPELHRVIVYVDVKKQMDVEFHMLVEKEQDGGLSLEQKELLWLEILQHHQHHRQKEGYVEEGVSADLASTSSTPSDVVL